MGNTFRLDLGPLGGHAVENYFVGPRAFALGERAFEGPKDGSGTEPVFWRESQDGLQVEGAVYGGRSTQPARSTSASVSFAPANVGALAQAHQSNAGATPAMGRQENPCPSARASSGPACARGANDDSLAGVLERRQRTAPTFAQRAGDPAPEADHSQASQCGVDSGFQRVVVHCRWQSSRTVDRTRFVQPLSFGDTSFARPEMVASKTSVYRAFSTVWNAPNHSSGQWRAFWIDRAGGLVALECLVGQFGNRGGIYSTSTSSGQWRPRTNAPGVEGRSGPACFEHPTGATAQAGALAPLLQSGAAARGVGPTDTRQKVSAQFDQIQDPNWPLEISSQLGSSSGAQQRTDPLAGTAALHRRSFCGLSDRTQRQVQRSLVCSLSADTARRVARTRSLWFETSCLSGRTLHQRRQKTKSVTYVLAS